MNKGYTILIFLNILLLISIIYFNKHYSFFISQKDKFIKYCNSKKDNFGKLEVQKNKDFEAVLIEFRVLPHIEYLLKNTISKLNNDWSHSVLCNDDNYYFIKEICDRISPNINIIKINTPIKNINDYNNLLLTKDFWNLFSGSKLLIYQEDTIMYHGNIELFLKYDYIGAPWKNDVVIGGYGGNGGFSLRTKKVMLKCLDTKLPDKHHIFDKEPEDVYFSKTINNFNLGLLADRETSRGFSEETIPGINPVGGHQFWLSK